MKCLTFEKIMAYLDGELTEQERSQIDKHLEACSSCREEFQAYAEDCQAFDELAQVPLLAGSFTREAMAHIAAEKQRQKPKSLAGKLTDLLWRGTIVKKITVVAAAAALAISLGTFVSPTFASYVGSLLASGKGTDNGLKSAAEHGLTTSVQEKVTDQGITFAVKEVFADPMRIAAVFGFEQDGKAIDFNSMYRETPVHGIYKFYVTDAAGSMVHEGGFGLGQHGSDTLLQIDLERELYKKEHNKEIPDNLVLHMEISQIGTTKGKWNLSIPVDLQKMREKTVTVPITSKYTAAPPGLSIELKQAVSGVSATQLSYELKLGDELMKKYRAGAEAFEKIRQETGRWYNFTRYDIGYRLVDDQGKEIAANHLENGKALNMIDSLSSGRGNPDAGVYSMNEAYDPTVVKNHVTFELTKVIWNELADFSFAFKPQEAAKKAQSKVYKGNTVTVKKVSYNPVENENSVTGYDRYKGVVLEVEVELAKDVELLDSWTVKDETGKRYEAQTWFTDEMVTRNKAGNKKIRLWITADKWSKIPKTITLEAHRMVLQNSNVNWKVPIKLSEQ